MTIARSADHSLYLRVRPGARAVGADPGGIAAALLLLLGAMLAGLPARAASIADEPVNENDYVEAKHCVALAEITETIVIDERHIVLVLRRHKYMLNQLRQTCQNLDADSLLAFSTTSSLLCDLDRVDVSDRSSQGRVGVCSLGRFEAISKDQLAAIKRSAGDHRGARFSK